jgi:uncharacterized membrane protein
VSTTPTYTAGAGPSPGSASLGIDENLAAALCYIPIVGLVFLLLEPYNKNRTIRFHAFQSLFYVIVWFVAGIALAIVGTMFRLVMPMAMWALWGMVSGLVELVFLVGLIYLAFRAFQGQRYQLPFVGPMAEKQAGA